MRATMQRQEVLANNLANVNTPGFRAETVAFRVAPVNGEGLQTRAFVAETTPGADFTPGVITSTGRTLDIAIQGQGFFAVQGADGREGYTRNGGFTVNDQGQLVTHAGQAVLGDGGPRHQATLQALLDAGADWRLTDRQGRTPLELARAQGYAAMVRQLQAAGAR